MFIEPKGSVAAQWSAVQGTERISHCSAETRNDAAKIIGIHCPYFLTLLQGYEALRWVQKTYLRMGRWGGEI